MTEARERWLKLSRVRGFFLCKFRIFTFVYDISGVSLWVLHPCPESRVWMKYFMLFSPYLELKDFSSSVFWWSKCNLTFSSLLPLSRMSRRSFIFCCFISWLNCKIKMKHIYMHNLSDEYSRKLSLMNTTENKSMYKNRKFCTEQYFTRYWFSKLKVYWKNPKARFK